MNELTKPLLSGAVFYYLCVLNNYWIMKKIVLFVIVFAGLVSCNTATDVPRLDLEIPKTLKENEELVNFVRQAKDDANTLARECVKMHEKAREYLDVDFDKLSPGEQEDLVKLDLEYVEMWYNFNIKHTSQTVRLMELLKDTSIPAVQMADMGKAIAAVNLFVKDLKDTYGEDLKLDPYPVEP